MWQLARLPLRLPPVAAALGLACLAVAGPARAQFSGDYFDPYRAAYRSSTLPVQTQLPGQVRTAVPPGLGTVPGIGTPWDLSYSQPDRLVDRFSQGDRFGLNLYDPIGDVYRQYDDDFGRVYRPNAGVDERFYEEQQERRQLYVEAMREPDPRRRAEMMRRYQELSRRSSLGMSPSASRDLLNNQARREESDVSARGMDNAPASQLPRTVRSYDDLVQWSRVVNREALRVGVVRPGSESN